MTTLLHQANTAETNKSQIRARDIFVFLLKLFILWPIYAILGWFLAWGVIYIVVEALAQLSRMIGG